VFCDDTSEGSAMSQLSKSARAKDVTAELLKTTGHAATTAAHRLGTKVAEIRAKGAAEMWISAPELDMRAVHELQIMVDELSPAELREALLTVGRAVLAWQGTADARFLEQMAKQVQLAIKLRNSEEFKKSLANGSRGPVTAQDAVDIDKLFANLG